MFSSNPVNFKEYKKISIKNKNIKSILPKKEEKGYHINFFLGICSLTRSLLSTPFQDPGVVPQALHTTTGQMKDNIVSNIVFPIMQALAGTECLLVTHTSPPLHREVVGSGSKLD